MDRDEALKGSVAPRRAERAKLEASAYAAFRSRFDLEDTAETLTLYLTTLLDDQTPTWAIRGRLQLLDLDRRLRGLAPWHQHQDVRTFLRGLFSHRPVGDRHSHYEPLYLELVHALVDACRVPSADQRRALAARMLRERLGLGAATMARLRWSDVDIGKDQVQLRLVTKVGRGEPVVVSRSLGAAVGDARCPVAAIRALRPLGGGEFVFGTSGRPLDINRLGRLLRPGGAGGSTPAQGRDRALLLIGYAAGLRTGEALSLRQRDVVSHDRGLVLSIQGRRRLTYLVSATDRAHDPATAWSTWLDELEMHGLRDPNGLAFRATNFSVIFEKGMAEVGLNRLVHQRAEEAGLTGRFAWTSLRTGMIRTAVRDGVRSHIIASQADLISLGSVQRHERRETLLSDRNVAGRLGL
ncbi:hypothetical protein F4692_003168 [Nocardioides cavernae]|uniref:Tyr recombinase domain-containing protein n=1 Tax=Nocardioides cavernae TaxID=1921566 RepID=A0A7Y9KUL8_9ACTN|nr:hypothetical protein [Nocardioides cavernae]NYE38023.1 hypothetical protein [Nocardioides cavernae]